MKKVITILFIIMIFITIIQMRDTYALYRTQITGEFQTLVGVWSVKINETDISSGNADMTFEITDEYLHFEDNAFTDGNYIAPGSEGYFDILIDATAADVSVKYTIQTADVASIRVGEEKFELTNAMPIQILGIEETFVKGEEIDTETEHTNVVDIANRTASGVIPLTLGEAGYCGKVRVHFKWVNDDNNNEMDTMLGNDAFGSALGYSTGSNEIDAALLASDAQPSIVIPVSLNVEQYMGEEITLPVTTP